MRAGGKQLRLKQDRWRLIDSGHQSAPENMARDAALLEEMAENGGVPLLRFEQFRPDCVLVGFHQAVEQEINLEFCKQNNIEINRRITGGGAIYEDESQVGWEIVVKKDHPAIPQDKTELFKLICEAVICGLGYLGVKAGFRPKNDIEVNGRKISGTGGTDLGDALLFHGSLLVDWNVEVMVNALNIPTEKMRDKAITSIKERVTCLAWEMGKAPPEVKIKEALVQGFAKVLGVQLIPATYTKAEEERYQRLLPYYRSDEWIYHIRRDLADRKMASALKKTPGGLVKLSLSADRKGRRIKQALLTGDFFCTPPRAVLDLESRLKDLPYQEQQVRRVIEEFLLQAEVPGVSLEDLLELFTSTASEIFGEEGDKE